MVLEMKGLKRRTNLTKKDNRPIIPLELLVARSRNGRANVDTWAASCQTLVLQVADGRLHRSTNCSSS